MADHEKLVNDFRYKSEVQDNSECDINSQPYRCQNSSLQRSPKQVIYEEESKQILTPNLSQSRQLNLTNKQKAHSMKSQKSPLNSQRNKENFISQSNAMNSPNINQSKQEQDADDDEKQANTPKLQATTQMNKNKQGFLFIKNLKQVASKWLMCSQMHKLKMLKAKHLSFFNDKTIIPNKETGFFEGKTEDENQENDKNLDEINYCQNYLFSFFERHFWMDRIVKVIPIFNPSHPLKLLFDLIIVFIILIYFCFIPISLAFDFYQLQESFDILAFLFFFMDIIVNLNTSFFYKGVKIVSRIEIFVNYIKNRAILDLTSLIPFIIYFLNIYVDVMHNQRNYYLFLFYIKIFQVNQIIRKLEEQFYQKKFLTNIMSLISLLLLMLFTTHCLGCLWIFVGDIERQSNNDKKIWLDQIKFQQSQSISSQYIFGIYYMMTTIATVGYGDVTPQNEYEMILCIFTMLFGSLMFGYSLNQIGNILKNLEADNNYMRDTLFTINNYMEKKNINQNLQFQIREYLQYYLNEQLVNNSEMEAKIINMLSDPLKKQLMIEANKIALKDSPIFRNNFSESIIQRTVNLITELRCTPEEIVFLDGDQDDCSIYFVENGKVELFLESNKNDKENVIYQLKQFGKGVCFGEDSFFTGQIRQQNVRSVDFTTLLKIKREDFLNILQEYPEDLEIFCKLKDSICLYQNFSEVGLKCQSCSSQEHLLQNCPLIHYLPHREKIIKQYNKPLQQQRGTFPVELKIDKYNALQNLVQIQLSADNFVDTNLSFLDKCEWIHLLEEYSEEEVEDDIEDQPSSTNQGDLQSQDRQSIKNRKASHFQDQHSEVRQNSTKSANLPQTSSTPQHDPDSVSNKVRSPLNSPEPKNIYRKSSSGGQIFHIEVKNDQIDSCSSNMNDTNRKQSFQLTSNSTMQNQVQNNYQTLLEPILECQNITSNQSNISINLDCKENKEEITQNNNNKQQQLQHSQQQQQQQTQVNISSRQLNINTIKESSEFQNSEKSRSVASSHYQTEQKPISDIVINSSQQCALNVKSSDKKQQKRSSVRTNSIRITKQGSSQENVLSNNRTRIQSFSNSQQPLQQQQISTVTNQNLFSNQMLINELSEPAQIYNVKAKGGNRRSSVMSLKKEFRKRKSIKKTTVNSKVLLKERDNPLTNTLQVIQGMQEVLLNKKANNPQDEFEIKKEFHYYFPKNNCTHVLLRANKKLILHQQSKVSLSKASGQYSQKPSMLSRQMRSVISQGHPRNSKMDRIIIMMQEKEQNPSPQKEEDINSFKSFHTRGRRTARTYNKKKTREEDFKRFSLQKLEDLPLYALAALSPIKKGSKKLNLSNDLKSPPQSQKQSFTDSIQNEGK